MKTRISNLAMGGPDRRAGFNLIEMIIAMAVIMTIVGIACLMLAETDDAWILGTGRAGNAAGARTAISMLTRDLQQAAADNWLTFRVTRDRLDGDSYGFPNDEVAMVSLQHDSSDSNRTGRAIHYWVQMVTNPFPRYALTRANHPIDAVAPSECYWATNWFDAPEYGRTPEQETGVVAENVAAFALLCSTNDTYFSGDHSNRLPEYVDIVLDILDARAARQASQLTPPRQAEFVDRNAVRYTSRVYLPNRYTRRP